MSIRKENIKKLNNVIYRPDKQNQYKVGQAGVKNKIWKVLPI